MEEEGGDESGEGREAGRPVSFSPVRGGVWGPESWGVQGDQCLDMVRAEGGEVGIPSGERGEEKFVGEAEIKNRGS